MPSPIQCTASTTSTIVTQTYLPAVITVPSEFSAVAVRLGVALAGPDGASLQQLLAPFATGSPVPQLVSTQFATTSTNDAPVPYPEGEPVPVGPEGALLFFPAPGVAAELTVTHHETVTEEVYQSQQVLDAATANFLLGDLHAAFPTTILDRDFSFIASLLGHAEQGRSGSIVYGDAPLAFSPPPPETAAAAAASFRPAIAAPGWTIWMDGGISRAELGSTPDHFGLSFTTADTALGAEFADGPWHIGGSLGFGRTGLSQPATGDTGTVTSIRAGAYVRFDPGEWSITGGLSAGYHWLQLERLSGLPVPITAEYGANSFSAAVEAVRRFNLFGADFEPFAGGVLSAANTGGFTESGTSLLELDGQPATTGALNLYIGARATGRHEFGNGMVIRPKLHGRVVADAIGDRRALTTSFVGDTGGASAVTSGLQPGRFAAQLGAGVDVEISAAWQLGLAYELQIRPGGLAHELSGSVSGKW